MVSPAPLASQEMKGMVRERFHFSSLGVVYPQTFYTDLNVLFCKGIA